MLSSIASRPLQHVAKVGDAAVRVVALLVVAIALVVPALVILVAATFKADAQDYANIFLERVVDLFKAILHVNQTTGVTPSVVSAEQ